ncbi:CDF family Co(II)/Ni(II) efflux transporter DmeF [Phenylobacterium soli]|uniref:Cation transporter n=2 Tax=Phenylobacterium soli TaxID=2170551 RepID=A0A328APQ8_9CAUL|nr:CDF family Co(II)/Ni(II) efflux transporter DmeF [Phenylobacterium soli]RAK56301.1 cation transporter [Phenylobacterium soli]
MSELIAEHPRPGHHHNFLSAVHEASERRTWAVIWLCGAMMVGEIVGGLLFGSIALVADGLHMSTHAGALVLAALAYTYARRHAADPRFSFGTGKLGDLAGYTSAIILAMISLLIGYEAVKRLLHPVAIHFREAIPLAALGLAVNVASAWLLSAGGHHHHGHGHEHDEHDTDAEVRELATSLGLLRVEVFEDDVPPCFRVAVQDGRLDAGAVTIETVRADGVRQTFEFEDHGEFLQSSDIIPEPHEFTATVQVGEETHVLAFAEHDHHHHRDNNLRAAVVHVLADAAVSVLVIAGLVLARFFGWTWMDPLAGIVGAFVIASWSYGLIRDTGSILLDMNPDKKLTRQVQALVRASGDEVTDLHVWRLGPGHLGAILSVLTRSDRREDFYRAKLKAFPALSHITVEIVRR